MIYKDKCKCYSAIKMRTYLDFIFRKGCDLDTPIITLKMKVGTSNVAEQCQCFLLYTEAIIDHV